MIYFSRKLSTISLAILSISKFKIHKIASYKILFSHLCLTPPFFFRFIPNNLLKINLFSPPAAALQINLLCALSKQFNPKAKQCKRKLKMHSAKSIKNKCTPLSHTLSLSCCLPLCVYLSSYSAGSGKFKSFKSNLRTKTTRKQANKQTNRMLQIHTQYITDI